MTAALNDSVAAVEFFVLWQLSVFGYPFLSCYSFKVQREALQLLSLVLPSCSFVKKVDLKQIVVQTRRQIHADILGGMSRKIHPHHESNR